MLPLPLEQQVSSLAPSQKMRDLGFPQKSLFYWGHQIGFDTDSIHLGKEVLCGYVSAYTIAELGKMLPEEIHKKGRFGARKYPLKLFLGKVGARWIVYYGINALDVRDDFSFVSVSEVDARADMIIYLAENGLLDVTKL